MITRLRIVVPVLSVLALLAGPLPARSMTGCTDRALVTASAATSTTNPVGNYPSCVPDLTCASANGCWIRLRGSATGAGLVSLEMLAEGLSQPVTCGPALRSCSAESAVFFVPAGGIRALCQTKVAAGLAVRVSCQPVPA